MSEKEAMDDLLAFAAGSIMGCLSKVTSGGATAITNIEPNYDIYGNYTNVITIQIADVKFDVTVTKSVEQEEAVGNLIYILSELSK